MHEKWSDHFLVMLFCVSAKGAGKGFLMREQDSDFIQELCMKASFCMLHCFQVLYISCILCLLKSCFSSNESADLLELLQYL